jgi:iron complex outermembrane recepter protein
LALPWGTAIEFEGQFPMNVSTTAKVRGALLVCTASAALFWSAGAVSADEPTGIETITVTAQKIAQPDSKVPLTISTVTGEQLSNRDYENLEDFKGLVPGLQIDTYAGEARLNIRGIGINSLSFGLDSQIAFNLNGVYVASARAADQAFLDVDRIEVVRGPQGTLYGRNATGGALNVITNQPTDDFEGYTQVKFGNYDDLNTQTVISGPIDGDTILGRLAFGTEDHSGYSLDLYNGKHYDDAHTKTARGTLLFNLSSNFTLDLVADFHYADDGANADHLFGTSPGFPIITGVTLGGTTVPLNANGQAINPRLLDINTLPEDRQTNGGIEATANWQLSSALSLKSITSYRQEHMDLTYDFDSTPVSFPTFVPGKDFIAIIGEKEFSQEFQFAGSLDWVNWVMGLYYFNDNVNPAYYELGANFGTPSFPFLVPLQLGGSTQTDAYAAYGQATFNITDKLHFTAGLRYSYEQRSATLTELVPAFGVNIANAGSAGFHDLSPKFGLDYQWNDGLMTFVSVSKGFQSGGFDIGAAPPLPLFQPETIWDYEGGVKYRNSWLSIDFSAFHYDYSNLQVSEISPLNGLPYTTNAAQSKINGAEFSGTVVPSENWSLTETFAYTDAYFTKFIENDPLTNIPTNLTNNQLPGAPRLSSNFTVQYIKPLEAGTVVLLGEWNWKDRVYFTEFNSNQLSQPGLSTFDATARYTFDDGKWTAELYGKNLSNELIKTSAWITGAGFGAMVLGQLAPPRTFGGMIRYQFN